MRVTWSGYLLLSWTGPGQQIPSPHGQDQDRMYLSPEVGPGNEVPSPPHPSLPPPPSTGPQTPVITFPGNMYAVGKYWL